MEGILCLLGYPKRALKLCEGDRRAVEPQQSPTPRSFAELVKREEVIAKLRTLGREVLEPGAAFPGFAE